MARLARPWLACTLLGLVDGNVVDFSKPPAVEEFQVGIAEEKLGGCKATDLRDTTIGGAKVDPARALVAGAECILSEGTIPQDCEFCKLTTEESTTCSAWTKSADMNPIGQNMPRILSYVIGIAMAYAIGGNDSANSLATSVGSGALTLTQAVWMGAFGEFLGATLLGAGVSSTIQRGVADINKPDCWACGYCNSEMDKYQGGMLAALFGAAFFLLLVTFWALPVSTTHAVVGGVVGMTMAAVGTSCLNWSFADGLGRIAAGWVVSPLVAGAVGSLTYVLTYFFIMKADDPKRMSFLSLPFLYGVTFAMMTFLTLKKAPVAKTVFGKDNDLLMLGVSAVVGLVISVFAQVVVVPRMRTEVEEVEAALNEDPALEKSASKRAIDSMNRLSRGSLRGVNQDLVKGLTEGNDVEMKPPVAQGDDEVGLVIFTNSPPTKPQLLAKRVFKNLLVMTAFIKCVGHGANDTANATGIVGAVQFVYEDGIHACNSRATETYIMAVAGAFVGLGVITMGYRVIKAVGEDLAEMDFHIGFCVEFSSALAVVVATLLELPVSTTHCQIGSIVFVAATAWGNENVNWGMFGKIAVTWVATLPAAGGVAYILTLLRYGS